MNESIINNIKQVASFLNVPIGEVSIKEKQLPCCTIKNAVVCGYINIVSELLKESSVSSINNIEVYQWLEYALVYASHLESSSNYRQVLEELNDVLANRTYLVSNRLTIADVILFYFLQNVMENLSCIEKEKYINVSRWFDNLQQNSKLRRSDRLINFYTNYLSLTVPVRN